MKCKFYIFISDVIYTSRFIILEFCNKKRKTDSDISLEELYNYFKETNSYEENDAEHVPNANDINLDVRNEILDAPIWYEV
jgi:hypothetical protein